MTAAVQLGLELGAGAEDLTSRLYRLGLDPNVRVALTDNGTTMVSFGDGWLRVHRGYATAGDGLVANDESGLDGKRARDADALTLSAGKLVRILRRVFAAKANLFQQLSHARIRCRALGELVDGQPFANYRADGHARIERCDRILEDDLHLAPQRAKLGGSHRPHIATLEADLA